MTATHLPERCAGQGARLRARLLLGPAAALAAAISIAVVDRHVTPLPSPGVLYLCAVALGTFLGIGTGCGILSTVLVLIVAALDYSGPGTPLNFTAENLQRLAFLSFGAPTIALMIGFLQRDIERTQARERTRMTELTALQAALDEIGYGFALLDPDLRASFMNRSFRRMWKISDELARKKTPFVDMMYCARASGTYSVPQAEFENYVAERLNHIRAGDGSPFDIKRGDGEVLRLQCTALPDGGRMLSYLPVTDLFRHAEALETLAAVDGLTGLYNRRHFMEMAEGEWARCRRYRRPLSVLMIDIDHFKSINDLYGHDCGDKVLTMLAALCADAKRGSDLIGRIGGEEFCILLPETDLPNAGIFAERLRQRIAALAPIPEAPRRITVSIGVAGASRQVETFTQLLKAADEALYDAKKAGRDRVATARPRGPHLTLAAG